MYPIYFVMYLYRRQFEILEKVFGIRLELNPDFFPMSLTSRLMQTWSFHMTKLVETLN